jgi:hypothetical protein
VFQHDAIETGQAVHLRHVDIERDDMRLKSGKLLKCFHAIAGEGNLEISLRGKDIAEKTPHQGRVIDNQQPDHGAGRSG